MTKTKRRSQLDREIIALVKSHKKSELAPATNRQKRNGMQLPLIAWMAGVKEGSKSKVIAVCSGKGRYAYENYWYSSYEVAKRIAQKKQITDIQFQLLLEYVCIRHRGHEPSRAWAPDCVIDTKEPGINHAVNLLYFVDVFRENGGVSLRALIDPLMTNFVLMKILETEIKKVK